MSFDLHHSCQKSFIGVFFSSILLCSQILDDTLFFNDSLSKVLYSGIYGVYEHTLAFTWSETNLVQNSAWQINFSEDSYYQI